MAKYSEVEALEEAVLLFARKLNRMHPDAYANVLAKLPDGAREALAMAENRAGATRVGKPAGETEWPLLSNNWDEEDGQ